MLLLLDECVPRTLAPHISGHAVLHVADMRWQGLTNGKLLAAMREEGFGALLTVDHSLEFQQPLETFGVSLVVMLAHGNKLEVLIPLLPQLNDALNRIRPGQVMRIGV